MEILPGDSFAFDGFDLKILTQSHIPNQIMATPRLPVSTIEIGSKIPTDHPYTQDALRKMIFALGKKLAPELLIEPAKDIADQLGLHPSGWRISRARKRSLGSCNSDRIISFSPLVTFMPLEVRNYIACHELTHLVHFNHSFAFHRLCNSNCLKLYGKPEYYFKHLLRTVIRDRSTLVNLLIISA